MIGIIFVLAVISVLLLIDNIRLYRAIHDIGKNLHELKDVLADVEREYDENIDLATELAYERARKEFGK